MQDTKKDGGLWIERDILYSDLSLFDKILLAKIDNLDNDERGCFAQDKHLALFLNRAISTIQKHLVILENLKLIRRSYSSDGNRSIKTNLSILKSEHAYTEKRVLPIPKSEYANTQKRVLPIVKSEQHNKEFNKELIKSENKTLAFDFLKTNCTTRLENEFVTDLQNKIDDLKTFKAKFNNTCEIENLDFKESVLIPRLKNYAIAWVQNQKESALTDKRANPNYNNAI